MYSAAGSVVLMVAASESDGLSMMFVPGPSSRSDASRFGETLELCTEKLSGPPAWEIVKTSLSVFVSMMPVTVNDPVLWSSGAVALLGKFA